MSADVPAESMHPQRRVVAFLNVGALFVLAACSNGRGSVEQGAPPPTGEVQNNYSVGGTVAGLAAAGLVLRNNGGDDLTVASNGGFAFKTLLAPGAGYEVTVASQPAATGHTCTVANGSGSINGANVTNVTVTCTTSGDAFSVGGSVSGLTAAGLTLRLNDVEDLAIQSNGAFTFGARLAPGASYQVVIASQPAAQTCTIQNDSGVVDGADVANVRVACANDGGGGGGGGSFSIGGAVSGLIGAGLVLQNNRTNDLDVSADGPFTFSRKLASGAQYDVRVRTQPRNPTQNCTVARGSGTVGAVDVANVAVSCTMSEFTIGGVVRNLSGTGLILRNNGTDERTINSSGAFTFATALPTGTPYNVIIAAQPQDPVQTCAVQNGSGVVGSANVGNIVIECTSRGFRIRGRVSDLKGSGLVLQNNGGDNLPIASSGRFTFPTTLPAGSPYNVTIARQPERPRQNCEVRDGAGTVGNRDVNNIRVRCDDDGDDDDD